MTQIDVAVSNCQEAMALYVLTASFPYINYSMFYWVAAIKLKINVSCYDDQNKYRSVKPLFLLSYHMHLPNQLWFLNQWILKFGSSAV